MDFATYRFWEAWSRLSHELAVSRPVLYWTLSIVVVGLTIGFYLGRCYTRYHDRRQFSRQRQQILTALAKLAASTDQLSQDVDSHSTELQDVEKTVTQGESGGFEEAQQKLLGQIQQALECNKRLEGDLVCARYQMQAQAAELDRTRHEARTDTLSGLSNRKGFDEYLEYSLARFERKRKPFALVLCDVDHFKWINDTHGHVAGDRVVMDLGAILKHMVRPSDFVARFGGDEFAMLLVGLTEARAYQVAERVRNAVEAHSFQVGEDGSRVAVTFSMGLATPRGGDTPSMVLQRADEALYSSKQQGRNQLSIYGGVTEPIDVIHSPCNASAGSTGDGSCSDAELIETS